MATDHELNVHLKTITGAAVAILSASPSPYTKRFGERERTINATIGYDTRKGIVRWMF